MKGKLIELGTGPQVWELLISKLRAVRDGDDPNQVPKPTPLVDICGTQAQIQWEQLQ